jgi:diguanylate cyclase (GGDEF)-like protein
VNDRLVLPSRAGRPVGPKATVMATAFAPLLDWLPRGGGIPHDAWVTRHRWVVRILTVQCVGLVIFALARGNGVAHSLSEALLPAALAGLATVSTLGQTARSTLAAIGLMTISTTLVHLSDGYIEAHFHFFVMIPVVAIYASWIPFATSVGIVLLHHGVMGTLHPHLVFNHPAAIAHPWTWGGIHALAIAAACLGAIVNWKAQERLRETEASLAGQLLHQANHDPLTGLPSRALFMDRLEQALKQGVSDDHMPSVLMLDMDGFKEVNDVFGHASGDDVLIEVARRLSSRVRPHDTVTRLGGDEYAVLLVNVDADQAEETAARLSDALAIPFELGSVSVELECSIGIATAGAGDEDASLVMRNADGAMYHAKEQRLGRVHYDDQLMRAGSSHRGNRLDLLGDLRRALQEHQIVLHYQPKVDLVEGRTVGVEALARWQHPERGLLQPAAFIEMVERTNLSRQFTSEVLSLALAQSREWTDRGLEIPIAVNLSRRSLLDPSLPASVATALNEHGVAPHLLILEINEMTVVSEPELAIQILHRLRALGVKVSLDDFGTGYSSLSYLKSLPIDELKIDRSFVRHVSEAGSRDSILVRATVELAHQLGLTVVAEGVEDAETQRLLGDLECDIAQGFHFARPMPASELGTWLSDAGAALSAAQGGTISQPIA